MPALVLFGRRWRTASDDFFYSGLLDICFSITWIVVFCSEWRTFTGDCSVHVANSPSLTINMRVLVGAFVVTLLLLLFVDSMITWLSTRGTIMDTRPRRHINIFIYLRVITSLAETFLTGIVMATFFSSRTLSNHLSCLSTVTLWTMRVAAIVFAVVLVFKAISCVTAYDSLGKEDTTVVSLDDDGFEKAFRLWKRRFKLMTYCCCIRKSELSDAFEDVSKIFASIFADVDLVTTDVLAGFLLLYGRIDMRPRESVCLMRANIPEWMNVTSAAHYFKYAVGCYGWPFFILSHPCCWLCRLAPHFRCCRKNAIVGDFCGCQMASLLAMTELSSSEADLIEVSFTNRVYEVPFFIAVDHETRAIVISVRGSVTFRDLLTDLDADCESLNYPGVPDDFRAHRGMVKTADKLFTSLCNSNALTEALEFHCEYSIVIVGHSLGAGVASLIGIRFRQKYPDVRCFLYGPPGGLFSVEAARHTERFQMSIIFGYDFVPRLSLFNITKMKESIIQVLQHCKTAKFRVFARGCWKLFLTKTKNLEPSGSFHNQIQQESNINSEYVVSHSYSQLQLPGRILHIFRNTDKTDTNKYQICWKEAKDFDEVFVTPNMLTDHVPLNLGKALRAFASNGNTNMNTDISASASTNIRD